MKKKKINKKFYINDKGYLQNACSCSTGKCCMKCSHSEGNKCVFNCMLDKHIYTKYSCFGCQYGRR